MKKRRTLALAMAGVLCFSSIAWADVPVATGQNAEQNSSAGQGRSLPKATNGNAEPETGGILKQEQIVSTMVAQGQDTVKISLKNEGPVYCNYACEIQMTIPGGLSAEPLPEYVVRVTKPSGDVNTATGRLTTSGVVTARASTMNQVGEYTFQAVEKSSQTPVGDALTVKVEKIPSLTVSFSEVPEGEFSKTYDGKPDESKETVYRQSSSEE